MSEPILVIGFNRPELLRMSLDRLRGVRPRTIYFAVDGPRVDREGEVERVQESRDVVASIDWECEVHTLFQDTNLGCGRGVSAAISWFFDHVNRGIILEDDVLPHPTFFDFCVTLLDRYENDHRVFAVSGCNLVPRTRITRPNDPYRFSRIPLIWGWATWKRSWSQHRLDISDWRQRLPARKLFQASGYSPSSAAFWASEFELTGRGDVDTWDWQLTLAAMASGGLTAVSNVNLVENVGFGADATHTKGEGPRLATPRAIELGEERPAVVADRMADAWATRHHFGGSMLTSLDRIRQYAMSGRPPVAPWR